MKHAEMHEFLTGKAGQRFVEAFVLLQKPWSPERHVPPKKYSFSVYPEFDLVEPWSIGPVGVKRPDAMIELSFPQVPLSIMDDVQVIVEFKDTVGDLGQMDIHKYDGYSDYMYLAIPTELMQRALTKVEANPNIGVFDITTGRILRLSRRQDGITKQRRLLNYSTMLTKYFHRHDFFVWPTSGYLPNAMIGIPLLAPEFRRRKGVRSEPDAPQERRRRSFMRMIYDVRVAVLRWTDSEFLCPEESLDSFYDMMDRFRKMAETVQFSDFEDVNKLFPLLDSEEDIDRFLQRVL